MKLRPSFDIKPYFSKHSCRVLKMRFTLTFVHQFLLPNYCWYTFHFQIKLAIWKEINSLKLECRFLPLLDLIKIKQIKRLFHHQILILCILVQSEMLPYYKLTYLINIKHKLKQIKDEKTSLHNSKLASNLWNYTTNLLLVLLPFLARLTSFLFGRYDIET